MPLSPGTHVGPYEITAAVGAGGMGEVYRARDTNLNRQVAIKVLPAAFAQNADGVARLRREAQVLASLNHPHIASIYGLEAADGALALVLEFVDGDDFAQRLARGAFVAEALGYARQIVDPRGRARKSIVHRDLKPNIKVTPRAPSGARLGLARRMAATRPPGATVPVADTHDSRHGGRRDPRHRGI